MFYHRLMHLQAIIEHERSCELLHWWRSWQLSSDQIWCWCLQIHSQQNRGCVYSSIFLFSILNVQVDLHDPVSENIDLRFDEKGVKVVKHETKIQFTDVLTDDQRQQYEAELDTLLRAELNNVVEVVYFDHNLRWVLTLFEGMRGQWAFSWFSGRSGLRPAGTLQPTMFTVTLTTMLLWPGPRNCWVCYETVFDNLYI